MEFMDWLHTWHPLKCVETTLEVTKQNGNEFPRYELSCAAGEPLLNRAFVWLMTEITSTELDNERCCFKYEGNVDVRFGDLLVVKREFHLFAWEKNISARCWVMVIQTST